MIAEDVMIPVAELRTAYIAGVEMDVDLWRNDPEQARRAVNTQYQNFVAFMTESPVILIGETEIHTVQFVYDDVLMTDVAEVVLRQRAVVEIYDDDQPDTTVRVRIG